MRVLISVLVILLTGYAECDEIDVSEENLNISKEAKLSSRSEYDEINGLKQHSWTRNPWEKEICTPNNLDYQYFPISGNSFEFKVKAQNDAHVILTETPGWSKPTYELVLGGWKNTRSVLRENNVIVASVNIPDIVKECEYQGFWIRWDNSIVRVGYEGIDTPILSYNTGKFFKINFFGIHTGYGSNGNWIF